MRNLGLRGNATKKYDSKSPGKKWSFAVIDGRRCAESFLSEC